MIAQCSPFFRETHSYSMPDFFLQLTNLTNVDLSSNQLAGEPLGWTEHNMRGNVFSSYSINSAGLDISVFNLVTQGL